VSSTTFHSLVSQGTQGGVRPQSLLELQRQQQQQQQMQHLSQMQRMAQSGNHGGGGGGGGGMLRSSYAMQQDPSMGSTLSGHPMQHRHAMHQQQYGVGGLGSATVGQTLVIPQQASMEHQQQRNILEMPPAPPPPPGAEHGAAH